MLKLLVWLPCCGGVYIHWVYLGNEDAEAIGVAVLLWWGTYLDNEDSELLWMWLFCCGGVYVQ